MTENQTALQSHCDQLRSGPVSIFFQSLRLDLQTLANSSSIKRWESEGPKVFVGSTITFGGLLEKVVCDHTTNKRLEYAQLEVKVDHITYFSTHSNLTMTPPCKSSSYSKKKHHQQSLQSKNSGSGLHKCWNWESLHRSSQLPQPSPSSSSATYGMRKQSEDPDDMDENEIKHQITDDDSQQPT